MSTRPTFIDLGARADDPLTPSRLSPRVHYNDGEIPPSLSPLDAFAAQSRMMAKQLDMEKVGEKRMSRLHPGIVTKSLSQHRADRPTVFRSLSGESSVSQSRDEEPPGKNLTIQHPEDRPLSQHPRLSGLPALNHQAVDEQVCSPTPKEPATMYASTSQLSPEPDYFALPRAISPETALGTTDCADTNFVATPVADPTLPLGASKQQTRSHKISSNAQLNPMFALSPTFRAVAHHESSDDDYTGSITGSSFSCSRKLSASSGISAPHSPLSPSLSAYPNRSPSITSEASINGMSAPRVHLNFSHPRSGASPGALGRGDPSTTHQLVNMQRRQNSVPTQPSTRIDPQPERTDMLDKDGDASEGGSSYTYTKFCLPRGRAVSRGSKIFQGLSTPHFEWKEPLFQDICPTGIASAIPQSPLPSPLGVGLNSSSDDQKSSNVNLDYTGHPSTPDPPVQPAQSSSPSESLKSAKSAASSKASRSLGRGDATYVRDALPIESETNDSQSISSASNTTVGPMTARGPDSGGVSRHHHLSPDEHVKKAIACHENGSLNESTYHLRIAAMQNHSTAMLLYALACRHGWGMRPNQREGVQWLRKALDSASLEIAEDEQLPSTAGAREMQDKQTRRAQFALSLYELGVSHLNGWGVEQDKALALRCFELAAHWGDVDALTEAGFCYTEGVGCKKDLKKAAKFYRLADQKGVSMVGNSWIYKEKYNNGETSRSRAQARPSASPQAEKARNKSRTRTIFGRKKSHQPA